MTGIPMDLIQTAFIVDNLVETQTGKQYGLYREFIVGTKFNVEKIILIYIDPHYVPDLTTSSKFGYEGGAEWPIFNDFFLRGGLFHSANVPTLGYGTRGNGFGLVSEWSGPASPWTTESACFQNRDRNGSGHRAHDLHVIQKRLPN